MPADYAEVLRDLDAQITSLEAEVATLKAGRPTIVLLRNKYSPPLAQFEKHSRYADMGPTEAIPVVLKGEHFGMTTAEIATELQDGGVKSNAQKLAASVSATLSQLKDKKIVRKIGDNWMLEEYAPPNSASPTPDYGDSGITDDDIPF